jgi:hypothetical protein
MRLGIIGGNEYGTEDPAATIGALTRFIKEHDISNPTIVVRDVGELSKLTARYAYQRGWDIIAIPCYTMPQMNTFVSCVDKIVSFVSVGDSAMMSFLRKARKRDVPVVYYGITPDEVPVAPVQHVKPAATS